VKSEKAHLIEKVLEDLSADSGEEDEAN